MPIHYYEQNVNSKLKNKRKLSFFLTSLVKSYLPQIKQIDLSYIFCDDNYLLDINRQFLNHDTFTDIITFDLSENATTLQGEIYISVERISENAAKFETNYNQELHRVIFHGALHLCGFKDKSAKDKEQMRKAEDNALNAYSLT